MQDITERIYPKDPQDAKPAKICSACQGEIYKGDKVFQVHKDACTHCEECFLEWAHELTAEQLADEMGHRYEEL